MTDLAIFKLFLTFKNCFFFYFEIQLMFFSFHIS